MDGRQRLHYEEGVGARKWEALSGGVYGYGPFSNVSRPRDPERSKPVVCVALGGTVVTTDRAWSRLCTLWPMRRGM